MNYNIGLWPGFGYTLDVFEILDAFSEIDAIDELVSKMTNTGKGERLYWYKVQEFEDVVYPELGRGDVDEVEGWMYIDATMSGARFPVYLRVENMKIF